jgi:hypothetical protein
LPVDLNWQISLRKAAYFTASHLKTGFVGMDGHARIHTATPCSSRFLAITTSQLQLIGAGPTGPLWSLQGQQREGEQNGNTYEDTSAWFAESACSFHLNEFWLQIFVKKVF